MASLATPFYPSLDATGRVTRISRSISHPERLRGARQRGMLDSSLRARNVARISRVAAAPRKGEEEAPEEDVDYELLTPEQLVQQRNLMNDIMKRKVRVYNRKFREREMAERGTVEEEFVGILRKMEDILADETPSEGMKQLVAMVESSPAFDEPPPPKYRVPQWLQNGAVITGIAIFLYCVAYVNILLDERDERKALEEEAAKPDKDKELAQRIKERDMELELFEERLEKNWQKRLVSELDGRTDVTTDELIAELLRLLRQDLSLTGQNFQYFLECLWFVTFGKRKKLT